LKFFSYFIGLFPAWNLKRKMGVFFCQPTEKDVAIPGKMVATSAFHY